MIIQPHGIAGVRASEEANCTLLPDGSDNQEGAERQASLRRPWPASVAATAVAVYAVGWFFRADIASAAAIWINVSTYSFCLLVPLISVYLIWRSRAEILALTPMPSIAGLAVVACCAAVWWFGAAAAIGELRQLAIVGVLQGIALGILGWPIYRRLRFPLLYLFLMVPTGTVFLGLLQHVTTTLASKMMQLTGIPVFTAGNIIEVPHGVYLVAPGCAGLNFLLAALALSLVYARLIYARPIKRAACVVFAVAIAIWTNGVRVFGLIWVSEITERRFDIIDDHLLYGWGFFALVTALSMAIGLRFSDPPTTERASVHPIRASRPFAVTSTVAACGAILGLLIGAKAAFPSFANAEPGGVTLALAEAAGEWQPTSGGASRTVNCPPGVCHHAAYSKAERRVDVFINYYIRQNGSQKLVDPTEMLVAEESRSVITRSHEQIVASGVPLKVSVSRLEVHGHHLLVWSWYWVGRHTSADLFHARLLGIWGVVRGDARAASVAVVTDEGSDASNRLNDFIATYGALSKTLENAHLTAE